MKGPIVGDEDVAKLKAAAALGEDIGLTDEDVVALTKLAEKLAKVLSVK